MNDLLDTIDAPAAADTDLMAPTVDCQPAIPSETLALIKARESTEEWRQINAFERMAAELPQQLAPLSHIFTPGLYTRILKMPAGMMLTSRIHMIEHPFVIVEGVIRVWTLETGWVTFRAPHMGITKPGTRRVLEAIEDTTWLTFHATNETDVEKIEASIFYDHMKLGHMDDVSPEKLAALRENQKGVLP